MSETIDETVHKMFMDFKTFVPDDRDAIENSYWELVLINAYDSHDGKNYVELENPVLGNTYRITFNEQNKVDRLFRYFIKSHLGCTEKLHEHHYPKKKWYKPTPKRYSIEIGSHVFWSDMM